MKLKTKVNDKPDDYSVVRLVQSNMNSSEKNAYFAGRKVNKKFSVIKYEPRIDNDGITRWKLTEILVNNLVRIPSRVHVSPRNKTRCCWYDLCVTPTEHCSYCVGLSLLVRINCPINMLGSESKDSIGYLLANGFADIMYNEATSPEINFTAYTDNTKETCRTFQCSSREKANVKSKFLDIPVNTDRIYWPYSDCDNVNHPFPYAMQYETNYTGINHRPVIQVGDVTAHEWASLQRKLSQKQKNETTRDRKGRRVND